MVFVRICVVVLHFVIETVEPSAYLLHRVPCKYEITNVVIFSINVYLRYEHKGISMLFELCSC